MARLPYLLPYDPGFLGDGFRVPMPAPQCVGGLVQSGAVFDYIHSSLVMHRDRRFAVYTAHNIDAGLRHSVSRTGWDPDDRVPLTSQTGPSAYADNPWDRGHLVRRAAVAWGETRQRAKDASDATFFYTNAVPQHERFNRDEWVFLEDWVLFTAGSAASRLCVFTGPLFTIHDQFLGQVRIPSAFWKVIAVRDPNDDFHDLAVLGFVMKQNEMWDDWNGASTLNLEVYQVGLAEIGLYTGIDFGELKNLDEFEWRQPRFRNRSRMTPIPIQSRSDITFEGARKRRERGIRALRRGAPPDPSDADGGGPVRSGDCGCRQTDRDADEDTVALSEQVDGLRNLVESLLDDDDPRDRDRSEAREAFLRIVGGTAVAEGDFPDCACIGYWERTERAVDRARDRSRVAEDEARTPRAGENRWFCSGVLVSPRVVLTAAHCAPDIDRVFLGGRTIFAIGENEEHPDPPEGEVLEVERVYVHPDYHPAFLPRHDIAVLVLEEEATEAVPVPIASTAAVNGADEVMLVGFGFSHPTLNLGFGRKRQVPNPLLTRGLTAAEIDDEEEAHGFDYQFEIHAGRKELGMDSCNGDSGGPAYIFNEEGEAEFAVAALTSRAAWSSAQRCGDGGIYTRIAPYLDWIRSVAGDAFQPAVAEDAEPVSGEPEATAPREGGLYISAALPNPVGGDEGHEWAEITNLTGLDVSLEGYSLADNHGSDDLSGAISAGQARRVVFGEGSSIALNNQGDELALRRGDVVVHRVTYTDAGAGQVFHFDRPAPPEGGVTEGPCGGTTTPGSGELPYGADPC